MLIHCLCISKASGQQKAIDVRFGGSQKLIRVFLGVAWLAQLVKDVTLDLGLMSS